MKKHLFYFFMMLILSACSSLISSSKMDKLELGMSKEQVTTILGKRYTIAEKRIENGNQIEILSYRDYDEFYMFLFMNDKLEKWYRKLLPKYETIKQ